ncbi:MAG: helix-turn-helix domain-containing protein [Hyphomicrobiaceae bacterium]
MSYASQDITDALKSARESMDLSQRDLSQRTGVPQSHISKIENGGADIRLSSLIELARALDLDLRLVPRKAVPAVDSVVRSVAREPVATPAIKEINRALRAVSTLRQVDQYQESWTKLESNLRAIKKMENVGREMQALLEITKPVREMQKLAEAVELPGKQIKAVEQAAQRLRNRLVHELPTRPSLPQPAYRVDDEGENDDS